MSVVVAVLNAARTIEACLQSVHEQRGADVELIVMDGGSTDGTREVVERNAGRIAHWESAKDRGIYHAWNKALALASGEWICFLGADDVFASPQSVATLLRAATPGANLVFGKVELVTAAGEVRGTLGEPWSWEKMKRKQNVAQPGALHSHDLFDRFGTFDERYRIAGDYDFLLRVGRAARPTFADAVVVRFGDEGLSNRQYLRALRETRDIQARHPDIGALRAYRTYAEEYARFALGTGIVALPPPVRVQLRRLRRLALKWGQRSP